MNHYDTSAGSSGASAEVAPGPAPSPGAGRPDGLPATSPGEPGGERSSTDGATEAAAREAPADGPARKRRRRGSRGGRNRSSARAPEQTAPGGRPGVEDGREQAQGQEPPGPEEHPELPELPERLIEGRPSTVEAAERALVRRSAPGTKPRIGDTMPAPVHAPGPAVAPAPEAPGGARRRRRRGGRGRAGDATPGGARNGASPAPVEAIPLEVDFELGEDAFGTRQAKERGGRPVGRYLMVVHVADKATQIAVLEGRALIEHYVSRPEGDASQIHGNIYLGKVTNVLPGMEAAFVDIGTPKNAVLYRGDVQYDSEDIEVGGGARAPRIEHMLKARQSILCQVTKNPIGAKGARLTQEVSLAGRFVVLVPDSTAYGISKRLPDEERKRLRAILDRVKPAEHGVIVRTAAQGATAAEIERDLRRLVSQWDQVAALAKRSRAPQLLYREPGMALRVIREEFNSEYRGVVIDDAALYEQVRAYIHSISPELADRVELYDPAAEGLALFERFHVHEQIHKALDRKVWLPSGGSLVIERTEALTVIDVNTGRNVGTSSLEETVFKNNLEAAVEIARQLRLRDIGGIIVIDFIDMEAKANRDEVVRVFRDVLARDKTRSQVFEISELGLCEMTRKRIGEGLLEYFADRCPQCDGLGLVVDADLLPQG